MRSLLDDGWLFVSVCCDVDPLLHKQHRLRVCGVESLLLNAGYRRHGVGAVTDPQRAAWLRVPSHGARCPHAPRKWFRGTEISVGAIGTECALGMTWVEEGEVVAVPEGRADCGRLVWTRAGSVACWEGDVEVGEVCRGEGVGEREGLGLCDPCVERGRETTS